MSEESEESDPPNQNEVLKEDVKLQFHLYISIFALIFYFSWVIPGILFFWYVLQVFLPYVLENPNILLIFIDLNSLLAFLLMPLVLIGCYLIRLFFLGLITRIFWRISEKISPSKSAIIPRNIRSRAANYYHIRSFMIKYPKNIFMKGAFPWLSNWFFNFVGSNKIGKGTTFEESVGNDKFVEVKDNCYFGVNSTLASHVTEGIFGNISYFKIKVGNNVTTAAMNQIGPGSEIYDNSFLLPFGAATKHNVIKGGKNYYFGTPVRKIFRKKIMRFLGLSPKQLEMNANIEGFADKEILKKLKAEEKAEEIIQDSSKEIDIIKDLDESQIDIDKLTEQDLAIDFTTSSAISRVNIKFLAVYLPVFWVAGLLISIFWYWYLNDQNWIAVLGFLPLTIFASIYFFGLACLLFSKLLLILVNLIHKPKEGIFKAEIGDTDFEFWMMRTELKKMALYFLRNSPLPWTDAVAMKLFGVNMDFSSHLNDAWCDAEFIKFGRKNLIGQGATVMSSMVLGKYLLIKDVIFDDYVMVGGHTTIAPGTIVGKETLVAAISSTTYNQILDPGWIYIGNPVIRLKPNKYAEERRDIITKTDVDEEKKIEVTHEVNIDEDKKDLIKTEEEVKES